MSVFLRFIAFLMLWCILAAPLISCGSGGSSSPDNPTGVWDKSKWDDKEWGQ